MQVLHGLLIRRGRLSRCEASALTLWRELEEDLESTIDRLEALDVAKSSQEAQEVWRAGGWGIGAAEHGTNRGRTGRLPANQAEAVRGVGFPQASEDRMSLLLFLLGQRGGTLLAEGPSSSPIKISPMNSSASKPASQ